MKKFTVILTAATAAAVAVTILVTAVLVLVKKPDTPPVSSSDYTSQDDFEITSNIIPSETPDESTPTISMPTNNLTPAPKLEYTKGGKSIKTGVSLDRFYDENSLTTTQKDDSYRGIRMWLGELDGLKDAQIESKINQNISDTLCSFIDKVIAEHEKVTYSEAIIYQGFANIISVSYHVYDGEDYHYKYHTYNLCDGLLVSLEDVFVDGADYTPIINDAFYREITRLSVGDDAAKYDDNKNIIPNINVEYETYQLLQQYLAQDIHEVGFSAGKIYFSCGTVLAGLEMRDIADKLAIFDRFNTDESLFEDDSIGQKDLIPFASICVGDDRFKKLEYGYIVDNLWYDTTITDYYEADVPPGMVSDYNDFMDNVYSQKQSVLEQYKKVAKDNPDKMYVVILRSAFQYYTGKEPEGTLVENLDGTTVVEMTKEYFDKHFKSILYDVYREDAVGFAVCENGKLGAVLENPNDKNIKYTQTCYHSYIDFTTGAVKEKTKLNLETDDISIGGFR